MPPPTSAASRPASLPGLTGLRGVGAIWVMLFHFQQGINVPVLRRGYLGVDLFFVLSGFILSHVYGDSLARPDLASYLTFLKVRLARIYPVHLLTLLVLALVVIFVPHFTAPYHDPARAFGLPGFVASLFLVQTWGFAPGSMWNGPSWSLSAEWLAYLVFPFLLVPLGRLVSPWRAALTAVVVLVVLTAILSVLHYREFDAATRAGMVRMAAEFTIGCLVYRVFRSGAAIGIGLVTAAWVVLLVVGLAAEPSLWADCVVVACFGLTVWLGAQPTGPVAWGLSRAPIVFLGEISYSLYMTHWIVLQLANWAARTARLSPSSLPLRDGVAVAMIFVLSYVCYRYVEMPGRTWGRRLGGAGRRYLPPAAALAQTGEKVRDT